MKAVFLFGAIALLPACGESRDDCVGSTSPMKHDPIQFYVFSPKREQVCDAEAMLTIPGEVQKAELEPNACNRFITGPQKAGTYKIEIRADGFAPFEHTFSISASKTQCGITIYSGYSLDVELQYASQTTDTSP